MNAAATAVNLTQPALTQALARLEALIGIALFERRYDGMVPTPAAELLVPRVRAALGHVASHHVTMSRLRAVLALADTGSYAAAAQLTGISPPSLHRAIADLSLSLRRPLVERRGKLVSLTEPGRQLVRGFRLARVELETGLSEVEALKGRETRRITIGAMPLSRARVLPAAITRFLARHPQVRLSIVEGSRSELIEPLRNGAIDLMIGALRDPLFEPDLAQSALFDDVPAVIARAGHPLAGQPVDPAALASYPWAIAGRGAPLRESFERLFADAGVSPPSVPVESGSVMTIRQLLIAGDFLTLLSPDQVAVELEAGWLITVAPLPGDLTRTVGVTTRESWQPTTVQAEFITDLHRVSAQP
jgi:DNA-binding transcriptional LysR family regulator